MAPARQYDPASGILTIRIPMTFVRHGGGKKIIKPDSVGADEPIEKRKGLDPTLLTALAKAWRWQKSLDSGTYRSLGELAEAEKINASTFSRTLRLTSLAPESIEAILDEQFLPDTGIETLRSGFPIVWAEQTEFDDSKAAERKVD